MAMRDLVSGGAACAVPGSSSSAAANPLGSLANALIGSSSKTQERLNEIPTSTTTGSTRGGAALYQENPEDYFRALPGNELDRSLHFPNSQGSEFLNGFRSAGHNGLDDVWNELQHSSGPMPHGGVPHLDHMYDHRHGSQLQPILDGPPQRVLSSVLHSFVGSSYGGAPFLPTPLPQLGLSEGDKQCIRDRSSIMARHFFGDKSEDFINQQVNALLSSLDIDDTVRAKGPMPGGFGEFEGYWNESQGPLASRPHGADGWINEFSHQRAGYDNPDTWASSFEKQHGANGWASEFEQEQRLATVDRMGGAGGSHLAAMEQSRRLAHTLTQNNDPKFQNSKFLQFVSKMSRGELIMDDNQVKPATSYSGDWATEYEQQYTGGSSWADEYATKLPQGPDQWVNEFSGGREQIESGDQWVDEFSKFQINDWVEEYGQQAGEGAHAENNTTDSWTNEFGEFLGQQKSDRGIYVFSDMNPYVGHPNPLKEGQELFRKGLLSEAVLALEAEVMKNPENAEVWRLLGIAHAENDDDQQAIAAMMSAQKADPTNLEVLLSLGVSHTNELEQAAALKYLYGWLRNHPKYGTLAPPELSDSLYHADVASLFNDAAQMSPEDADVHIVLGVLYNLSREFDKAIASFKIALQLKPQDYSLWNKLGATQANSVQSADAILAYQKALDLKPNYVRAWANIGISYANQGLYEESIRYYVRALAMNPKADNAWQYLKISLSCALRKDMLEACESRNLDLLQKEFPL